MGVPPPPLWFSHHAWRMFWYKTLEVPQDFTPSFEPVLCELLLVCVKKKMEEESSLEESSLSDLAYYINVNGEEAFIDAVGEERTELERAVVENEIQADVMFLRRRRRLRLEQEGARLLARFYATIMVLPITQ